MAGDQARVAQAYVEIAARKARDFDSDARKMGQEAGKEYRKAFDRAADESSAQSRGRHAAEGRRIGTQVGDAAGREAGRRTSNGITESLVRSRSRRVREGEVIGAAVGTGAERSFRTKFLAGVRATSDRASSILESGVYQGINRGFKRGLIGAAGIGLLASSASGLTAVIAGTVGAVSDLSGVLGLLPGILVSAGIAAGTLKLGLHGVGDAIKNSGDPKAYAQAIEKLSPAAKGFTDAIVKMRPQLKALQQSVQQGLFKGAGKEIESLGARYLPLLKRGLTETSEAFGRGRAAVASYLDTAKTAGVVSGILDDTSLSADGLSRAFKPFVSSLLDIASVGTTFLPALSSGLADAAVRFAAFTTRTKDSGQMRDFFQGGIDAVGDLGSAVKGVARIIGGIFKAGGAANTSPLEAFAKLLHDIADTVNKPAFQAGLSNFFDAVATAGEGLGEKMGSLGDALVALEPTISRIVAGSGVALPSILDSIAKAATSLAPTLNFLGATFEAIAPHAGPIVIALLAVKGALLALSVGSKVVAGLAAIQARILTVGTAAVATRLRLLGMATSLRTLGFSALAARLELLAFTSALKLVGIAGAVVGVGVAAGYIGEFIGKAQVAKVSANDLAASLKAAGQGGELGRSGLHLFSEGMGPFRRDAKDSAEALDRFGVAAGAAFGDSLSDRIDRMSDFGQSLSRVKEIASQLDPALASLAKSGQGEAASSFFDKLIESGVKGGASVKELTALFPQFGAAIAASGQGVDATSGKVRTLTESIDALISKTEQYANRALGAQGAASNYQAALDAATAALKRNGEGLSLTSAKGRENAQTLRDIASTGLASAKFFAGEGPNSQARFRDSLLSTRKQLIQAAHGFGLSDTAAKRYADRILRIPSKASTGVFTPGMAQAIANAQYLKNKMNNLPDSKVINVKIVTTEIQRLLRDPGYVDHRRGERQATGGLVQKRAIGGLVDPRLGAPRQDNVPLLVSGGEFVMNAFATSQPGVLALLRKINASNQMPQKLASGGQVRRASAGFGDITASTPARLTRIENVRAAESAPAGVSRMHPDDITAITQGFAVAIRQQRIILDSGAIAGAVEREGGRRW